MEDLYSIHPGILRGGSLARTVVDGASVSGGSSFGSSETTDMIKAQIASHPRYPSLLSAYMECRKVGASPEMAALLEEIGREFSSAGPPVVAGGGFFDPELDEFMESYWRLLVRFKEELSKPFDEATSFLNDIELQLNSLWKSSSSSSSTSTTTPGMAAAAAAGYSPSDEPVGSSEQDINCTDVDAVEGQEHDKELGDHELKEMLLKKYSGCLSSLRMEFLKKTKKGKLPKDASSTLLDWWNSHYLWPYPTGKEKAKLGEKTGLDHKQINSWFTNQRKRHWNRSDGISSAVSEGVSDGSSGRKDNMKSQKLRLQPMLSLNHLSLK